MDSTTQLYTEIQNKSDGSLEVWTKNTVRNIWMCIAPVILIVGLSGNIVVFLVARRRGLRGTTTSVYLQLMAIADNATLIFSLLPDLLEETDAVVVKNLHAATCKTQKFLQYISLDVAVWLLVAFAVDRFVAVCFPFYKVIVCRPKNTKITAGFLLGVAVMKNLHVFWTRGPQEIITSNSTRAINVCGFPSEEYADFSKFVRPWIVLAVVSVIPLCVLVVCNSMIVAKLSKSQNFDITNTNNNKLLRQMTVMCLGVSLVFILCTIPSIIMLIGRPWWSKSSPDEYTIAKGFLNMMVFVNHSINFFVYSVTGKRFRHETKRLFCCIKKRQDKHTLHTMEIKECLNDNVIKRTEKKEFKKENSLMIGTRETTY